MGTHDHCMHCGVVRELDEDFSCDECTQGIRNCPVSHVEIDRSARANERARIADQLDTFGWSVENLRAFQGRLRGESR